MNFPPQNDLNDYPDANLQFTTAGAAPGKSAVVSARTCQLLEALVRNTTASAIYVQLHDAAALPANGTRPSWTPVTVPANSHLAVPIVSPITFLLGLVIAASSTEDTLTLAGSDCLTVSGFLHH